MDASDANVSRWFDLIDITGNAERWIGRMVCTSGTYQIQMMFTQSEQWPSQIHLSQVGVRDVIAAIVGPLRVSSLLAHMPPAPSCHTRALQADWIPRLVLLKLLAPGLPLLRIPPQPALCPLDDLDQPLVHQYALNHTIE